MALIFNSITQFVIQPERTKKRVKRDELDTLTEVWVGPIGAEDSFIPPFGSRHSAYTLMTLMDSAVKEMPALVAEVTLTYQGKLDNAGGTGYTSVPTINRYWSEGEVSYQVNSSAGYTIFAAGIGYETISQPGVASYSRRYTGRCVEIAYITNRLPSGFATQLGAARGSLGFLNVWDTFSGFSAGTRISGAGMPFEQIVCTDVKVQDLATGWYKVTETYQSRMFPGDPGIPISTSAGTGTGGNTLGFPKPSAPGDNQAQTTGPISLKTDSAGYPTDPTQYNQMMAANADATKAYQAAQGSASDPLQSSLPGSAGFFTTTETGLDPAWANAQDPWPQPQLSGADAASSTTDLQTSYESQFLDY
jgi:hypothetical protein